MLDEHAPKPGTIFVYVADNVLMTGQSYGLVPMTHICLSGRVERRWVSEGVLWTWEWASERGSRMGVLMEWSNLVDGTSDLCRLYESAIRALVILVCAVLILYDMWVKNWW